jgi:amidase
MTRAAVVAIALCLSACGAPPSTDPDSEIVMLDAIALRAELAAGRLSAERVTRAYLNRIAELDDAGPTLNAVIEINPDALDIARDLDARLATGPVGALHGVPVLIKANIDTADRMATTAGSLALAEHFAAEDAPVVARLRAAGAVVLGKTNLSEWANFRSTQSISGWSSIGGQTRNPYVLDRNPCGSSSGSAVTVAARLAPLAIGTETDGSIVCPAAASGVVGVKPAVGTVSQRGIVPIAASQDTAGPLARTVADAALLLAVLAGDTRTAAWTPDGADVTGLRIGVVRDYGGAGRDAAVEAMFTATLRQLEAARALLIDPVETRFLREVADAERTILLTEFRDGINEYLAGVERGPRSLAELIAFNDAHSAEVMPLFGQELLLESDASGGRASATYAAAIDVAARARAALGDLFTARDLDALVAPANSRAWRNDAPGGGGPSIGSSRIAAVAGYASIVVPIELSGELPLGLAVIVQPGDEPLMLTIAASLERLRGPFPEPRFLASIGD